MIDKAPHVSSIESRLIEFRRYLDTWLKINCDFYHYIKMGYSKSTYNNMHNYVCISTCSAFLSWAHCILVYIYFASITKFIWENPGSALVHLLYKVIVV